MTRYYSDCRETPSEMNCSIKMSADSKDELMEALVQHVVSVHSHTDGPELREMLEEGIHQE